MLACQLVVISVLACLACAVPSRPVVFRVEGVRARRNFDSEFGGETNVITKVVTRFVAKPNRNACYGLPYGVHGVTCSPTFIVALPNMCSTSRCRAGYVFNEATQQCTRVDEVSQCHGTTIAPVPITAAPVPITVATTTCSTTTTTTMTTTTSCSTTTTCTTTTTCSTTVSRSTRIYGRNDQTAHCSCRGRDIGVFPIGCSRYYCSCRGGVPTRLACPEALVFDDSTGQCRAEEYVPICGGVRTTTAMPYVQGSYGGRHYYMPY